MTGQSEAEGKGPLARQERLVRMAEMVLAAGSVHIEDLVKAFGVSAMTVYRDIASLEDSGVVHRARGLISAAATSLNETTSQFRLTQNTVEKAAIAARARQFVRPGRSVMLDDSSSAYWLLQEIVDVGPLTIVTNSQHIAREAGNRPGIELFVTGGIYRAVTDSFYGGTTTSVISNLRADVCFLSATAVGGGNLYHPYEEVVDVKRAMLGAAVLKVLLVDHTKFERHALHVIGPVGCVDVVVVDALTRPEDLEPFRAAGVRVEIAEPNEPVPAKDESTWH